MAEILNIMEKMMRHLYRAQMEYMENPQYQQEAALHPLPDSPQEGFDFLFDCFKQGEDVHRGIKFPPKGMYKGIAFIPPLMWRIYRGISHGFRDMSGNPGETSVKPVPNPELWTELETYARTKWGVPRLGFTEVPAQMVFRKRFVPYRYAVVVIQEMRKEYIDKAPAIEAGREVIRVYAALGEIVNDLADWLRSHGVKCMANHPLRGLVLNPPLAGKAGLGWQGSQGLLITPEYGVRQRIAPVFVEQAIFPFTDARSREYRWIEQFCAGCQKCARACPTQAILKQRKVHVDNVPTIGQIRTCIDIRKCFPQFGRTFGCSICVRVCPFSGKPGSYDKLKAQFHHEG